MSLVLSVVLIIVFVIIYYLLIQIFTVLFRLTGLTKEKAHFQVISMLTNSGFTTKESELITNNLARRKLAKSTMISGTIFNVLIASLFINLLFSLNKNHETESLIIMAIAIGVFIVVMLFLRLPFMKKGIETLIEKIATKINERNHHENVITELDSYGKKTIVEVYLNDVPESLKDTSISNSPLKSRYNIIVLLIQRNKRVIDVTGDTMIQNGDKLVLFGKTTNIKELFDIKKVNKKEKIDDSNINSLSIIDNYGSNAVVEIEINKLPKILKNKTLAESVLKEKYDINVMMIKHGDKPVLVDATTTLEIGDKVILFGPYEHIKTLFKSEEE